MKKPTLIPFLVLLGGVVLTEIITIQSFRDLKLINRQDFENKCQDFSSKILSQLKANAQVLYSSAAYISSSDSITREEWKNFQAQNQSITELPGIQGMGYVKKIEPEHLGDFEKLIRNEGFRDFKVMPEGPREFYTSVMYIEPLSGRNLRAFGFDGYTEPIRKKAMQLAEKSNAAVISDKVILVQETDQKQSPGTIMFAPVFKTNTSSHGTTPVRYLSGWVYSPFRMNDLITGILGELNDPFLSLIIYDNGKKDADSVLFDSEIASVTQKTPFFYSTDIPMVFNQKTWTLSFYKYQSSPDYFSVRIILVFIVGIFISILLFTVTANWLKVKTKSDEIFKLNQELEKSNMNKDRFISVLAHDLRSPLNTLLGFTDLLKEKFDTLTTTEQKTYTKYIHDSATGIFRLLDDLLTWARLDTGKFPFYPAKTDLGELCKTVVEDYNIVALKKKITLIGENIETPHFVFADSMMLKTLLRNLVDNAIKFSPENGRVTVKITNATNKIIVSVTDNGAGMSAEEKAKLFNISTISSRPGTANEKGTGMGLILCADLVKKHNGTIWVDSAPEKGTTVSFSLPVA